METKQPNKCETGVELLSRLTPRPKVEGLQIGLFGETGPLRGDVIEITGKSNTGKTALLTHWIATCILPIKWNEIPIGGLQSEVVLVNTDHHFCILQLGNMIERRIAEKTSTEPDVLKKLAEECLQRLFVFDCFDKTEFLVTLHGVKSHVLSHPHVAAVLIDSINSFYWEDRLVSSRNSSMEAYCQTMLRYLLDTLSQTSILLVYTKLQCLQDSAVRKCDVSLPYKVTHQLTMKLEHGVFSLLLRTQQNAEYIRKNLKISKGIIQFL